MNPQCLLISWDFGRKAGIHFSAILLSARRRRIQAPPLPNGGRQEGPPCGCNQIQLLDCIRSASESALRIRLFLTACVASIALAAAWAGRESQIDGAKVEDAQVDGPETRIHYAPRENLESVDAREIGLAQLSIDMAAYVLSDPQVIEALVRAAGRGVVIRLYFDRSQFAEHGPKRGGLIEALLANPNVAARVKGEGVLMHLKAYAIDGQVLRTGSGNFSRSGLAAQDNDLIFISDRAIVDAFENNFERIWARAQNIPALDATR